MSTRKNKEKRSRKESVHNKKHLANKNLRAKEIIAKNKSVVETALDDKKKAEKTSLPRRIFRTIKRVFFVTAIIVFTAVLVSFLVVRIGGGTPNIFGYSIQRIVSGSMIPTFQVGDIILCKTVSDPSEVDVGDIVTFKGGSAFDYNNVTHRVIAQPMVNIDGEYVLTTKGDANNKPDEEILFSSVNSKFINKIDFLIKIYDFFVSPWGLLVFIAALLIIFFDELLTVAKVITGNYKEEIDEKGDEDIDEDESIGKLMQRIKFEEEQAKLWKEEERMRRRNSRRYDNTSNKKKKRRKKYNYISKSEK